MEDVVQLLVKGADWLLAQGAVGVLCLTLVAAVLWLIKLNEKKQIECEKFQAANVELWNTIVSLQEKRISEKEEIIRALETARTSIESNTNATAGLQASIAALHAIVMDRRGR